MPIWDEYFEKKLTSMIIGVNSQIKLEFLLLHL